MRDQLKEINGIRKTFIAAFARYGTKTSFGHEKPTVLFLNVRDKDNNNIITDHLWFNLTKGFEKLDIHEGDTVQFDARVKSYEKGYRGYRDDVYCPIETDYKLSNPTKISIIKKELVKCNAGVEDLK